MQGYKIGRKERREFSVGAYLMNSLPALFTKFCDSRQSASRNTHFEIPVSRCSFKPPPLRKAHYTFHEPALIILADFFF